MLFFFAENNGLSDLIIVWNKQNSDIVNYFLQVKLWSTDYFAPSSFVNLKTSPSTHGLLLELTLLYFGGIVVMKLKLLLIKHISIKCSCPDVKELKNTTIVIPGTADKVTDYIGIGNARGSAVRKIASFTQ